MTTPPTVVARPCAGQHDLAAIDAMSLALPGALHRADLPWRLASPALQDPANTRLWETPAGDLVGWAILQWPWHCLDFEIRPGPWRAETERQVFGWAVAALDQTADRRGSSLPFYISARAGDAARRAAIARAGFADDGWSYLHLARDLALDPPAATPPEGLAIRAIGGEPEVGAYVAAHRAAFGSTNMTADWRRRTLRQPRYEPDLDLVAVGPDGEIAAFCVGWLSPPDGASGGRTAQVEPIGVLPAHQRHGLGRALLHEVFRRSRALGATRIEVDCESYNDASRGLYEAVSFRVAFEAPFARRVFGAPAAGAPGM